MGTRTKNNRMILKPMALVFALSSVLLLGVSRGTFAQSNEITVYAASSLTDAFTEVGQTFTARTGTRVKFQFAGSQILKTQLENGAPADVFASANAAQYDPLVKAGLLEAGAVFARNRLVVIAPRRGPGNVKTIRDLGNPGVKLVIADRSVPVGALTRTFLETASKVGGYGADFADRVLKNVVSEESNVRQVALKVSLGEADAGVVYTTDVTPNLADSVIQLAIPPRLNQIGSYPIGVRQGGPNLEGARAFVAFVRSVDGQRILAKWGFLPPSGAL
jgi:molybdate transport system substrate-binding protein